MGRMQQTTTGDPNRRPRVMGRTGELIPEPGYGIPLPKQQAANCLAKAGFELRNIRCLEQDSNLLRRNKVITGLISDSRAAGYRATAARLLESRANVHWNGLAVTSPGRNSGKTLTAINIAMALAGQVANPVVIVDLDFPGAAVQSTLGLDYEMGLSDYLQRRIPLDWVLIQVVHPNLLVVPAGKPDTHCFSRLDPAAIQQLHDDLRARLGDCTVLYDLPPLLSGEDGRRLIPAFDAALLVVEDGVTLDTEINDAFDFLVDTQWVGTILNKTA